MDINKEFQNTSKLGKQVARGVKWLVSASFFRKALSVGTMVILARILNPSIFGIYALAFVAIDGLGLFKTLGFDAAVVQRKNDTERAANTAFFIIPLNGFILFLILNISAPFIGGFLNNREIVPVMRILGLIFIFNCFSMIPKTILHKQMRFAKVAFTETISAIIYLTTTIILALLDFGIWSLVIGYLAKTIISMLSFWYFAKWRPKFIFDKKLALEMFHFGKFLFLGSIVWFLKMNLDNLLVGKLLGVTALGLYAIAFNIANFNADYFGSIVHRTIFPAYSRLQDDIRNLKTKYLKTLKYVSVLALPFGISLFLLSSNLLNFIYGPKWTDAASVLRILAWAGIFNALPASLTAVFVACGKPKLKFWITSLQVGVFFIFIAPMAKWFGIEGIALVVAISAFIAFTITLSLAMKLLSISFKEIYSNFKPSLIASLVMALGIISFRNFLLRGSEGILFYINFIVLLLFALALYSFSLFKIEKKFFKEAKRLVFA